MAFFERGNIRLHYEVYGEGPSVLAIAPGGLKSAIDVWPKMPWNPIDRLAGPTASPRFQVIAMDQRNAGQSTAPVTGHDGWHSYAADQLALLDHLGLKQFSIVGMCIGGPYIMGLIRAAPERVRCALMLQPIGLDGNRAAFQEMFDAWAKDRAPLHSEADTATWTAFGHAMFGGDFMFNTSPEQLAAVTTPILVAMGNDLYHPSSISRQVADLLPNGSLIEHWKQGRDLELADEAFRQFLGAHGRGPSPRGV